MVNFTVLISGTGRTLRNLLDHNFPITQVVASNLPAFNLAKTYLPSQIALNLTKNNQEIFHLAKDATLVLLAGWTTKLHVPKNFENKILNMHPSLLPKFGGKGMFGHHVHEKVIESKETESGCTVHVVDNEYDHGPIILQTKVPVLPDDTPDTLAHRVFDAECQTYPKAIAFFLGFSPTR